MRRIYSILIALGALLLLAWAVAGSGPNATRSALAAQPAGVSGSTASQADTGYQRKLPPTAGTIKPGVPDPSYRTLTCSSPVVNASQRAGNEDETFVVVNPTNPNNIVAMSNLATENSIFRAYSMNGGSTWTRGTIATGAACCDAQAVFDTFGNLFVVYINGAVNQINVILSTDGGATFTSPLTVGTGSVDQPSIAVGNGSVWVDWNLSGNMVARGAPVTGLGTFGPFAAQQSIPSASGSFGGIAVGPGPNGGKVMVTYMSPTSGQGPATIYANVDADGLGAGGFGARITVTSTNVGGFDFIPAQSGRSIDAEAGLVWDSTGGPFNNRVYLVYTEEPVNESNDTEIYLRTSTDDGTTWTAPVRVNDDPLGPIRSQFLPYIALDRSSGTVAIGWYDSRNDNGVPGSGGTNNTPNDDAEYYASYSTNGGVTWAANQRLSSGFSNAADAAAPVDYGDYIGTDAYGGKFVAVWADNANCDGTNPDGTLHAFDLYMGALTLPAQGTPTPTVTGTPPTATRTSTPVPATNTPTATATACATNLQNGGFETGDLTGWTVLGTNPPPVASNAAAHSGTYSALVGTVSGTEPNGDGSLYQQITVPAGGATLSYWWNGGTTDSINFDWQDAYITNTSGTILATIMHNCQTTGGWVNQTFNLAPYAGQTVRVEFLVHQDGFGDDTYMYVDDVQLQIACGTASVTPTGGPSSTPTPVLPTSTPTTGPSATNTSLPSATSTVEATNTVGPTGTAGATNTVAPSSTTVPPSATVTTAASPTATPTLCAISFSDVHPTDYFYEPVRYLYCHGVISGYGDNTFRPYNNTTRAQMVKIVVLGFGIPVQTPAGGAYIFHDVPPSAPFFDVIETAAAHNIISGYNCGPGGPGPCDPQNRPYFLPNNPVTRGQLSKIDVIAAGWPQINPTTPTFTDVPQANPFYTVIETAVCHGVVSGYADHTFHPFANATRGQISKIVYLSILDQPGSCAVTPAAGR